MASFSFNLNNVLNALPLTSIKNKAKNAFKGIRSSNEGKQNPHAPTDNDHDEAPKKTATTTSKKKPIRQKRPKVETKYCDKCMKDEEEKIVATHHCSECNMNFCEAHVNLHNSSNKTKSHVENGSVSEVATSIVPITLLPDLEQVCVLPSLDRPFSCALDTNYGSLFVCDGTTFIEFDLATREIVNSFKDPNERMANRMCYDHTDDTLIFTVDRCAAHDVVKMSRDGKMIHWECSDQHRIADICVDRVDGTIYTVQFDSIVFIKNGKVITTLKDNINGNNMFVNITYDSILGVSTDFEGNLIVASKQYVMKANKKGKILSKNERVSSGEGFTRIHLDPNGETVYYVGDSGIESSKLNGTCRTEFRNDKADYDHKFDVRRGEGMDMAIDFSTGEVYALNAGKGKVQIFK